MTGNKHNDIPAAPRGRERLRWLGPAFIWMLSAAGSGELLFTPRIAAQYGYSLFWALIVAVFLKWCVNREIGRYTVCSGASFLRGLASISSKSSRFLWLILLPQLVVAIATVAGLAGAAATAAKLMLGVPLIAAVIIIICITGAIILFGKYKAVEKTTTILAITISMAVLTAAIATKPDINNLIDGLKPVLNKDVKTDEVLPWLGFMLAGAAGLMWFSYWTAARGYGSAAEKNESPLDVPSFSKEKQQLLKGWIGHMTVANTLAVIGGLCIAIAFLILGTELLQPKNLVPEENKVAEVLSQLMGGVWGRFGFWFMAAAVFITFTSTLLSGQDGFVRMFTDGTSILAQNWKINNKWKTKQFIHKFFLIVVLALFPIITYMIAGEPVGLLKIAGAIEACHIPVVAFLILYLNLKTLPPLLRPGWLSIAGTGVAGIAFAVFAVIYIIQMI